MVPSLLALPPEIQEMISEHCLYKDGFNHFDAFFHLRLTCRGIEAAIRRNFARSLFDGINTTLSLDDLARLVGISATPDLAAAVTGIRFRFEDDHELYATKDGHPSSPRPKECSELLTTAFRGLRSVTDLRFVGLGSGRDYSTQPSEIKWALSSISISFMAVMLAAQMAGIRPQVVNMRDSWPNNGQEHKVGLDCCQGLALLQTCFSELEDMDIYALLDPADLGRPVDGLKIGQQLLDGFAHMRNLKRLGLEMDLTEEAEKAFRILAFSVYLPQLDDIELSGVTCTSTDLVLFLHRHASTLQEVFMNEVQLVDAEFHTVLQEIRDNMRLELLILQRPMYAIGHIKFPGVVAVYFDDTDEDGWVKAKVYEGVRMETAEEVKNALPQMLSSMEYEPFN